MSNELKIVWNLINLESINYLNNIYISLSIGEILTEALITYFNKT